MFISGEKLHAIMQTLQLHERKLDNIICEIEAISPIAKGAYNKLKDLIDDNCSTIRNYVDKRFNATDRGFDELYSLLGVSRVKLDDGSFRLVKDECLKKEKLSDKDIGLILHRLENPLEEIK